MSQFIYDISLRIQRKNSNFHLRTGNTPIADMKAFQIKHNFPEGKGHNGKVWRDRTDEKYVKTKNLYVHFSDQCIDCNMEPMAQN